MSTQNTKALFGKLKYILMGQFPKMELQTYNNGMQIPDLGQSTTESASSGPLAPRRTRLP